jgi:hypothetical protein
MEITHRPMSDPSAIPQKEITGIGGVTRIQCLFWEVIIPSREIWQGTEIESTIMTNLFSDNDDTDNQFKRKLVWLCQQNGMLGAFRTEKNSLH